MINFTPSSTAERAQNGMTMTDVHTTLVAAARGNLTTAVRAEIGQAMAEVYFGASVDASKAEQVASDLASDLFHCADGLATPAELLRAAVAEQRAAVSMAGVLLALGEEGQAGRIACALAAVLDFTEIAGICTLDTMTHAYNAFTEEVEAERSARTRP